MADTWLSIASETLTAAVNPLGAELSSLRDAQGRQLMTDADPAYWTGRAPLLFPIIGELVGGRYRLKGQEHALPRHGFARRMPFAPVEHGTDRLVLRLTDTAETRALYPFAFTLDVEFVLANATLTMSATATNHSDHDMPASFGFHPAFAWPLPYGAPRETHRIRFEQDEPEALKQLVDNLIAVEDRPTPVDGRTLALADALFEKDALIWEGLASERLTYGPAEGPCLEIAWGDMPNLGLWTKPGAPYLCIEPWAGIADRAGFQGEIWQKPGIWRIAPGQSDRWWMSVTLT
ncbi:MAG TPA: aldose 1-epimerase family protein [Sphingobium sp.]|nr:aldose 1-epimerase family protein [Sphingobium sp.]